MLVKEMDETHIREIGHAFGYYNYGKETSGMNVCFRLDTDAKSKCDKYMHLGMQLAGTRRFGESGMLYDLIKYPDAPKKSE